MSPRALVTSLALGRLLIGGGIVAAPGGPLGAGWLGEAARGPIPQLLLRGIGARDVGIAIGTLSALRTGSAVRPWLLAATLGDVADFAGTLAARGALPRSGVALVGAMAGGAAVAQVALARELD